MGTTPPDTNPHYKQSPRWVWSGVSPDGRLAFLNDVKLTLRDLGGNNTVRACLVCCCFFWDCIWVVAVFCAKECGIATPHGEHMPHCRAFLLIFYLFNVFTFKCLFNAVQL
ncbi:trans-sialidase [Trypanosoma cruzi]|nr:trans-sialidase [Trypanosoma cruzi]